MLYQKKNIFVFLFLCQIIALSNTLSGKENAKPSIATTKKKLVILTSKGGFGHMAACDSLRSTLGTEYDITIVNPFEEIISDLDIVKKISFKTTDCEQFYNKILNSGWLRLFNFNARHIVPFMTMSISKRMEKRFFNFLKKTDPDLLISVIPVLNLPASNAAWRLRIPYLMITLDYDLTMWLIGMKKAQHQNITITVADDHTKEAFLTQSLPKHINQIHTIGVPIRKAFFEKRDVTTIKEEWNIPANKPVVMLMMGGAGSAQTYYFFKELARFTKPLHILICMGRNTRIEKKIRKVLCNEQVSYTCIPFTTKITDLMAISDLLITKPGPGTVTEAMFMQRPVILDRTITSLFWEKKVFDLVGRHQIGCTIKRFSDLNKTIEGMLYNFEYRSNLKHAFKNIKPYNFDNDIKTIIQTLSAQRQTSKRPVQPLHSELPFLRGCRPSFCHKPEVHLAKNYQTSHPRSTLIHGSLDQNLVA